MNRVYQPPRLKCLGCSWLHVTSHKYDIINMQILVTDSTDDVRALLRYWKRYNQKCVWFVRSTQHVKMKPLFIVTKNAGTVTGSTRSAFMESVIVTDRAGRRRKGTERGGTERKRRDVTSRLAGKKNKKLLDWRGRWSACKEGTKTARTPPHLVVLRSVDVGSPP